jgi:exopolysaccharide biosynthesis protein
MQIFRATIKSLRAATRSLTGVLLVSSLVVASAACGPCYGQAPAPQREIKISWELLSEGLEETHFQIPTNALLSSSVVAVRADPSRFAMRVIRSAEYGWKKATVRQLCKASGASVCINSNFFDEQGKPLGVVISRGIQHQKMHNGGGTLTGVIFATANSISISHRGTFSAEKVIEASQAGPRLISEGAPVVGIKGTSNPTNLSIACLDKRGAIILLRVSLAMFGSSMSEIQHILLHPSFACMEALNFDGGGSSQMHISGGVPGHQGATREEDFPGRDEVPVAIGLFRQ